MRSLTNRVNVMSSEHREFTFLLYCNRCKIRYDEVLTEKPRRIIDQVGHDLGEWSYEGETERVCKVCVDVIFHLHIRKRHDITAPSGKPIVVVGTSEETEAMFDHFSQNHPSILRKAAKELGFKLKRQ